jgi:hypothetical protein
MPDEALDNEVDRRHRARTSSEKLRAVAEAEGIELGPQLVGALQGLAEEIRAQRLETIAQREVTERLILTLERFSERLVG